jgi:hypothetical protein
MTYFSSLRFGLGDVGGRHFWLLTFDDARLLQLPALAERLLATTQGRDARRGRLCEYG